jgi:hypothetical protein
MKRPIMLRHATMVLLASLAAGAVVTAAGSPGRLAAADPPAAEAPRQGRGPGGGRGYGRGQWDDPRFIADREAYQFLLQHRDTIRRTITPRPDGVETLTESDDPEVAGRIQEHVASMHDRVKEGRVIHMRDPLFREVFRHREQIVIEITDTEKGVQVIETSDDPHVAELIKAHAEVVSKFIENGPAEVRRNHRVP